MAGADGICGEDYAGRMVAITILSSVCVLTVFGNTMVGKVMFCVSAMRMIKISLRWSHNLS